MRPNRANRTMWTGDNLCNACNSRNGNRFQSELIAALNRDGIIETGDRP